MELVLLTSEGSCDIVSIAVLSAIELELDCIRQGLWATIVSWASGT